MLIHDPSFLPVAQMLREAGQTITEPIRRRGAFDTKLKSDNSLVTIADTRAQAFLTRSLAAYWPGAKLLGEESFDDRKRWQDSPLLHDQGDVYVNDPIDGTRRFARGDDYGMMMAHKRGGVTRSAWVYYPVTDTMLFASQHDRTQHISWAADGTMRARAVSVPKVPVAEITLRVTSRTWPEPTSLGPYAALQSAFASVQRCESVATDLRDILATGRVAQFMDYNTPWDRTPVAFLAERAGAPPVVDFNGKPATDQSSNFIIAPTRPVMAAILGVTAPMLVGE